MLSQTAVRDGQCFCSPELIQGFLMAHWRVGQLAGGESFPRILLHSGDPGTTPAQGVQAEMGWGEV